MRKAQEAQGGYVVSNATLRTEDLLEAFALAVQDLLEEGDERPRNLVAEALGLVAKAKEEGWDVVDAETAEYLVNEDLLDLLQEAAPECHYFGSHEGDGACFGFWFDPEAAGERDEALGHAHEAGEWS